MKRTLENDQTSDDVKNDIDERMEGAEDEGIDLIDIDNNSVVTRTKEGPTTPQKRKKQRSHRIQRVSNTMTQKN